MAPRGWATQEQRTFLTSHLDEFFEMQNAGKLSSFWPKLQNLWFQQWPEPGMDGGTPNEPTADLTVRLQERNKQLQNWFYNNRDNRIRGGVRVKPLKLEVKQTRTPTAVQLYSAANYEESVKESVRLEIQEKAVPKNKMIEVIKRKTTEIFLAEPPEVQQFFKDESEKLREQRVQKKRAATSKDESTPTPASYAAELKNLNRLMELILTDLNKRTGWTFLVLAGGPDPSTGKIRTCSFNEGRNMLGHTFAKSHSEFEDAYIKPFVNFLKQAYPPSVREARRLSAPEGSTHAVRAGSAICDEEGSGNLLNETPTLMNNAVAPSATIESSAVPDVTGLDNNNNESHHSNENVFEDDEANSTGGNLGEGGFPYELIDPALRPPGITSTSQVPRDSSPSDTLHSALFPDHPGPLETWARETNAQCVTLPRQEDHLDEQMPSDLNSPVGFAVQSSTNTARPRRQPTAPKETGPLALRNEDSALTEWLKSSYNCLLEGEEDSDSVWSVCIEKWAEFEKGLPLANLSSGRLPATKQRPQELSQWLTKRDFSNPPQIANIAVYIESLKSWWADLQIARSKGQVDGSLQHLRKGGPNGVVTLMFGLRWWQLNMDQQNSAQWNAIVEQVKEMFESFVRKRKSDSQPDNGTKRRKRVV